MSLVRPKSTPPAPSLDPRRGPGATSRFLASDGYRVHISADGTGSSFLGHYALTPWRGADLDENGWFLYLRDRDSGDFWSASDVPARSRGRSDNGRIDATWEPGRFTLSRTHDGIATAVDICVAVDAPIELRRLTIRNTGTLTRVLEITSFVEVALAEPRAFNAHPVFSKLFLQTQHVSPINGLFVKRRPRSAGELHPWMMHASPGGTIEGFETDRARFIGRARTLRAPRALTGQDPLSETVGNVLDPALCLRRTIRLDPGEAREALFLLGAGPDRDELIEHAHRLANPRAAGHVFDAAGRKARRELDDICLSRGDAEYFQALAGTLLYRGHGLLGTGERALVIVDGAPDALRELIGRAHRYWNALDLPFDLTSIAPEKSATLPRLVIRTGLPELGGETPPEEPPRPRGTTSGARAGDARAGGLRFFNSYGGFSEDGSEYRIPLSRGKDGSLRVPPRPWVNVIANEHAGFLVSETGAGCTWSGNSREHPLTPWWNDPVVDPHGEAIYIRDDDSGAVWSPCPGPAPGDGDYETRHGLGWTGFEHRGPGFDESVTVFMPRHDPVKATLVTLMNTSTGTRRVSVFAYHRLALGPFPEEAADHVVTSLGADGRTIFGTSSRKGPFGGRQAFLHVVPPHDPRVVRFTGDRAAFIGRRGSVAEPEALVAGTGGLDGCTGQGLDPCFACELALELAAGASCEIAFLLGEGANEQEVAEIITRAGDIGALRGALDEVRDFWRDLAAIRIETPSPALDLMVNGWLPYQTLSCRMWGRTALYQASGAFGFRDQLQDAAAFVHTRPALTRAQLLLHAAHQFVEGDVLHWWHPPASAGIRTRCSDDLLWLPYLTSLYVDVTGDSSILAEMVRFITGPAVPEGEDETWVVPSSHDEPGDLYDHCCRAIDRSLSTGPHGLPLFGTCDWNDGMNRVGRRGIGESTWMGFFLVSVLENFIPRCRERGDSLRAGRYAAHATRLSSALNGAGWDGAWYRRGWYDSGEPLGSKESDECRIDALAQAWAVISGVAPADRGAIAMDNVERHLISEADGGLVRLLTPPFEHTPLDPGYIKGYVPGIRENGGQYTHAALWVVQAMAKLGRRTRVARLLDMLNPVHHARTADEVARYQVEPYAVAADIYSTPPHVGRGGWTWYTGSAGWMYRVAIESLLGIRMQDGQSLRIHPCLPDDWPEVRVSYRLPDGKTCYEIHMLNPDRNSAEAVAITIHGDSDPAGPGGGEIVRFDDGGFVIPLRLDGQVHHVTVVLGAGAGPRDG